MKLYCTLLLLCLCLCLCSAQFGLKKNKAAKVRRRSTSMTSMRRWNVVSGKKPLSAFRVVFIFTHSIHPQKKTAFEQAQEKAARQASNGGAAAGLAGMGDMDYASLMAGMSADDMKALEDMMAGMGPDDMAKAMEEMQGAMSEVRGRALSERLVSLSGLSPLRRVTSRTTLS